jgi:hypothetical protein
MTKTQLFERLQIREDYAKHILGTLKNPRHIVPLQVLEDLYNNIPEEMHYLTPQMERIRLKLDPEGRDAIRLPLSECKYRAQTIMVRGRRHPIRIFNHRYSNEQLILNWTQSYRINLANKRPMTLDIFYGGKNGIPLKGSFVSDQGLQASERVVDNSDRAIPEQNILKVKALGQSGYYALGNRNFFEDRSLPSGLPLQRFILGPNTRQSILRAACYLAKLADYNDWRVTETIYRTLLHKWLYSLHDANQIQGFQGVGLSKYTIDRLSTDSTQELDTNPEYPKLIRVLTDAGNEEGTLQYLNKEWTLGESGHDLKLVVTPNLIGPFHIHQQAVSLQSKEAHTQSEHQHNIKEAVRTIVQSKAIQTIAA